MTDGATQPDRLRRRDLFRWRSSRPGPATAPPGSCAVVNASRGAMGTTFEVRVGAMISGAVDLATHALDVVDDLEGQLTVYRDDSEVSQLNASAHLGPVAVEAGLFDLLAQAVALHRATAGAYDVAVGALSEAWGFVRGPRRVPDPATLADAQARSGSHHLTLDPVARTVAFDRPGVVVNLGSIGKGYAIDRAADVLRRHWLPTSGLVHGGRSSLYALGSPPGNLGGRWPVALRDPYHADLTLGTVHLRNRGMGTSGASYQRFEVDGRSFGHIIDPRTGEPPDLGLMSVTVLAPTATEADALSTAFSLLGVDATRRFLADRPEVAALFAHRPDPLGPTRLDAINLTTADFTPRPDLGLTQAAAGR